ncbi:hypothetical protein BJ508DRAFT_365889 [Ascobolus immersus RN42]|uniref:Uncharacterized protein n=1 Tax=Ascobolus immersus RN42 TaxID=1160509 RepID=A0A3N4HQ34_ASCIM|nr:hypothetical protein BJ508DRAFT_365889 [Ascobolus immersus RN42]
MSNLVLRNNCNFMIRKVPHIAYQTPPIIQSDLSWTPLTVDDDGLLNIPHPPSSTLGEWVHWARVVRLNAFIAARDSQPQDWYPIWVHDEHLNDPCPSSTWHEWAGMNGYWGGIVVDERPEVVDLSREGGCNWRPLIVLEDKWMNYYCETCRPTSYMSEWVGLADYARLWARVNGTWDELMVDWMCERNTAPWRPLVLLGDGWLNVVWADECSSRFREWEEKCEKAKLDKEISTVPLISLIRDMVALEIESLGLELLGEEEEDVAREPEAQAGTHTS